MSCPTCSHTMELIGYCDGGSAYHCPRCGTVKHTNNFGDGEPRVYVPKLVERCRVFSKALGNATGKSLAVSWQTLGISESIHTPEERGTK